MKLPVTLQDKLIDFLKSLPNIGDTKSRMAFIYSISLDSGLKDQIPFDEPPAQFIPLLVSALFDYGKLDDGRYALEAVLDAAKDYVGSDREEYCNILLKELERLREELQINEMLLGHSQKETRTRWQLVSFYIYFISSCGIFLGVFIYIIANIFFLNYVFRYYIILFLAVIWIFSIIGIKYTVKIPLFLSFNRFYYKLTYNQSNILLFMLALIFVLSSFNAERVIYCLTYRYLYSKLIKEVVDFGLEGYSSEIEEKIRQAFILIPWRKEAQMLLARNAQRNRVDQKTFRKFIKDFVDNELVEQAVENASTKHNFSYYLITSESESISDPIIWYASIMPEAEDHTEMKYKQRAIDLLSTREEVECLLVRTYFEYYVYSYSNNKEMAVKKAGELRAILDDPDKVKEINMLFIYQVACDILAQNDIASCTKESANSAYKLYRKILETRNSFAMTGKKIWHRSPRKLSLYHMFRLYGGETEGVVNFASEFLERCKEFKTLFEKNILKNEKFKKFKEDEEWFVNSTLRLEENESKYYNNLLDKGWRY